MTDYGQFYNDDGTLISSKSNDTDYSKWNNGDNFIGVPAKELLTGGIAAAVILEKVINAPKIDLCNVDKSPLTSPAS